MFKQRIGQVEYFIRHPHLAQKKIFTDLIQKAKFTEFGKEHHFSSIQNIKQYQECVPIRTYEQLFPYIEKIIKGHQNILWPSEIKWFAKSSGTTSGTSKFLPVSKEQLEDCHYKGGKDVMTLYCYNNPDTQVFSGKSLIMGGSLEVNQYNKKQKLGDVSAVMMQNMPMLGHFLQTPDLEIALMEEWEEKLELIVKNTIHEDVTNFAGVPTWTLVMLKRVLEITGKHTISEVWPTLELFIHGGINFEPYRAQFKSLIGNPNMNYYQTYNASEGFFAMQDGNDVDDMLLMLDYGIFYEFIPKEELHKEFPNALSLNEVEVGKLYALIISTNAGLWRYQIGDTIQFTSTNPYRIKVVGRTKSFINAFGEELIVENADTAIQAACEATNGIIKEYTAGPIFFSENGNGAHEWFVEFIQPPNDINRFKNILDETLQAINTDYKAKRHKDLAVQFPTVHIVPMGTFEKWLSQKGKLGGQNKIPRLNNDRKLLEELITILNNDSSYSYQEPS